MDFIKLEQGLIFGNFDCDAVAKFAKLQLTISVYETENIRRDWVLNSVPLVFERDALTTELRQTMS